MTRPFETQKLFSTITDPDTDFAVGSLCAGKLSELLGTEFCGSPCTSRMTRWGHFYVAGCDAGLG